MWLYVFSINLILSTHYEKTERVGIMSIKNEYILVNDLAERLPSDVTNFCIDCFQSQKAHFGFSESGGIDLICDVCGSSTYLDVGVLPAWVFAD